MKSITVKVTTEDGKDNSATSVIVETNRGAGYLRTDGRDIVTNKDKEVTFNLRQGQRLVIEAYTPDAVVYDRTQGAAYKPSEQESIDGTLDEAKLRTSSEDAKKLAQETSRLKAAGIENPSTGVPKPAYDKPRADEDPIPGSVRTPAHSQGGKDAKSSETSASGLRSSKDMSGRKV